MNAIKVFVQTLMQHTIKMTMIEFFKEIHSRFYSHVNISFTTLEECENNDIVHCFHIFLNENLISNITEKLNMLSFDKSNKYTLHGVREKNNTITIYFKSSIFFEPVDSVIYCDYCLLIEKIINLYITYERAFEKKITDNITNDIVSMCNI